MCRTFSLLLFCLFAAAAHGENRLPRTSRWETCADRLEAFATYLTAVRWRPQPPPRFAFGRHAPEVLASDWVRYADGREARIETDDGARYVVIRPSGHTYARTDFRSIRWIAEALGVPEGELTKRLQGKAVLDLGCASGRFVRDLRRRGIRAYGIDILLTPEQRRRPDVFIEGDLLDTQLEEKQFDVLMNSHSTGGLYDETENALRGLVEGKRLLSKGGRLLLGPLLVSMEWIRRTVAAVPGLRVSDSPELLGPRNERWVEIVRE